VRYNKFMPEVYKASVGVGLVGRARVAQERLNKALDILKSSRTTNPLSSFAVGPERVRFETQEEEEPVILMMRQHPITNLGWILMALLLLWLPTLFSFLPFAMMPGRFQVMTIVGWYLMVLAYIVERFLYWFFNVYIITDERVVDVDFYGLLYRDLTVAKLDKIQDINFTQAGSFAAIFNYGNIYIQTAAERTRFEFMKVPNPAKVVEILYQLLEEEEKEVIEGRVK